MIVFGGTCPTCFGEIPGEEAATDPGEEVKARQEEQDKKRLKRRMIFPILLASVVVLGIFTTAVALLMWPEPQMAMLDLDDDQYADLDLDFIVAEEEPVAEEAKAGTGTAPKNSGGTSTKKKTSSLDALRNMKVGSVGDVSVGDAAAKGGPDVGGTRGSRSSQGAGEMQEVAVPKSISDPGSLGGGGDLFGGGMGGATISRNQAMGITLTDDNQIIQMVQRVMRAELRKLKACYTQQLKADENLKGDWVLNFTVAASGATKDIDITAKQAANAGLEQCMNGKITRWKFQPIKADLPVKKTVKFKPSY